MLLHLQSAFATCKMVYWSFRSSATLPINRLARSGAVLTVTKRQVVSAIILKFLFDLEKLRVLVLEGSC